MFMTMAWLGIGLVAIVICAIAWIVIAREVLRLSTISPRPVFDLEVATQEIGDRLNFNTSSQLSYSELRQIIDSAFGYLDQQGLVVNQGTYDEPVTAANGLNIEQLESQIMDEISVFLPETTYEQVHDVVVNFIEYLRAIGAAGPANSTQASGYPKKSATTPRSIDDSGRLVKMNANDDSVRFDTTQDTENER